MDATLLEKVETSIESNKSLQMLFIFIRHSNGVVEAVLKGACGNTSLKKLTIGRSYGQKHLKTVNELRQTTTGIAYLVFKTTQSYLCVMIRCTCCTYMCLHDEYMQFFCNSLTAY